MFPLTKLLALSVIGAIAFISCGKSNNSEEPVTVVPNSTEGKVVSKKAPANPAITKANEALQTGAYDEAAARLLEARAASQTFTPADANAYRDTMQDAYSKAVEAAGKGDPKAKAALEMIRAARQ